MTTGKTPKNKKIGKDSRALTTYAEPQIIQSNEAMTPIRSFRVSRDKSILKLAYAQPHPNRSTEFTQSPLIQYQTFRYKLAQRRKFFVAVRLLCVSPKQA
jgi:hypothetical protein